LCAGYYCVEKMLRSAQHDNLLLRAWFRPAIVAFALACGLAIALLPQSQFVIFAVAAVALIVIAAIFAEPILGLALALIVGPFQPLERISLQLPIDSGQAVLAITLLAYGFRWLATRQSPVSNFKSPITIALSAFIVVCLLSFFPARDFADWTNEVIKWAQMFVIALLVGSERDSRKRAILVGAIVLSAAGQAIYGIVQADVRGFGPNEFRVLGSETSFRAYGTFEQPNPFGGYLGLTWPLAAAVGLWAWRAVLSSQFLVLSCGLAPRQPLNAELTTQNSKFKILSLVLAIMATAIALLCLVALDESGSRGALIGAGAAAAAMLLVLLKHPWRWIGVALALAFALFAFDVVNAPALLEAQLDQFGDAEITFGIDVRNAHITPLTFSTIERLAHWQAAIRMMESSPWLGVGFGNYAATYPEFRLLPWENALGHAHNYYLNIFAETGAIGFVAYIATWITIIVVTIRTVRSHLKTNDLTLKTLIAVGVLGAFAHLAVHHLFDNLYVANMHLLIGAYLGFVIAASVALPDGA
jgi:hypothetical protein